MKFFLEYKGKFIAASIMKWNTSLLGLFDCIS